MPARALCSEQTAADEEDVTAPQMEHTCTSCPQLHKEPRDSKETENFLEQNTTLSPSSLIRNLNTYVLFLTRVYRYMRTNC